MFSCSSAHIKEPQPAYVINTKTLSVAKGIKSFNYKQNSDLMGEWIGKPVLVKWSDIANNLMCFPLEIWLTRIKPALKNVARKNRDDKD